MEKQAITANKLSRDRLLLEECSGWLNRKSKGTEIVPLSAKSNAAMALKVLIVRRKHDKILVAHKRVTLGMRVRVFVDQQERINYMLEDNTKLITKEELDEVLRQYLLQKQNAFDEDLPFILGDFERIHNCQWILFDDLGYYSIDGQDYSVSACWTEFPGYLQSFNNRSRFCFYECVPQTPGAEVKYATAELDAEDFPEPEAAGEDSEFETLLRQAFPGIDFMDEEEQAEIRRMFADSIGR